MTARVRSVVGDEGKLRAVTMPFPNLNQMKAELLLVSSLRAVRICAVGFVVFTIGLGYLMGLGARQSLEGNGAALRSDFTPELAGFQSVLLGLLWLVVLAAFTGAVSFRSNIAKQSFLMAPNRTSIVVAKTVVLAGLVTILSFPTITVAYLATQSAMGPFGSSLGADRVPESIVKSVILLVALSLFALGVALVSRNIVTPIAALLPLFLTISTILLSMPLTERFARYLPDVAGWQIVPYLEHPKGLGSTAGAVVLSLWTFVSLAIGLRVTRQRDVQN